ncbi:adenylate kinase 8-like [Orbicella faveolata]|uniref:adenylate kinase 8-like n=1 Tax=Orbicella faveolata TaxID=48498 RepID=UPI0009E2DFD4|nr:adenylate kinase 8-like [Orbicella faveolata]
MYNGPEPLLILGCYIAYNKECYLSYLALQINYPLNILCLQSLLTRLIIERPADPLTYMIGLLEQESNVPQIIIHGPPAAGKRTMSVMAAQHFNCVHITLDKLVAESDSKSANKAREYISAKETVPTHIWVGLIKERLEKEDCISKGWLLEAFPQTREQVIHLFIIHNYITFNVTSFFLGFSRYHLIYNPPRTNEVKQRLQTSAKDVESAVNSRIADYQAYIEEIAEYYEESGQHINADQDIHTVFECIESIIVNPIPRKNGQGGSLI